jgi:hypothetical protein
VEARFSAHVQTGPGVHPASCTIGTESFPGVKRPRRGADHPPPPSAEVENEYNYTSTPPLGHSFPVIGRPFSYTYIKNTRHYYTAFYIFLIIHHANLMKRKGRLIWIDYRHRLLSTTSMLTLIIEQSQMQVGFLVQRLLVLFNSNQA